MADIPAPARRPLRFSSFELDLQSGELREAGVLVGLQVPRVDLGTIHANRVVAALVRPGDEAVERNGHVTGYAGHLGLSHQASMER